jgi:ferredoxin, 2Fe-2S
MKATWRLADGREISADVREGMSLMEAAVAIGVPRVVGECGGNLSCATCHVVVEDAWAGLTGTPDAFEDAMLDVAEAEREPNSRLSCQIRMRAEIDGIVVRVPEA